MYGDAPLPGLLRITFRHAVIHKPCKVVSHTALSGFISEVARHDAVFHQTANTGDTCFRLGEHHMTGRSSHNDHHLSRLSDPAARQGRMGVNDSGSHRRTRQQTQLFCHRVTEVSRRLSDRFDRCIHLLLDEMFHSWIQRFKKVIGRISRVVTVKRLVSCAAGTSCLLVGHLPDDPVQGLHHPVRLLIHLRRMTEGLQYLRDHPLAGYFSSVERKPFLSSFFCDPVNDLRLFFRAVVFPELHVSMGFILKLLQMT